MAATPVGESHDTTLSMRGIYAKSLSEDPDATLDDLREATTTLEETGRVARRVLGGAHPTAMSFERVLKYARGKLRARETPSAR